MALAEHQVRELAERLGSLPGRRAQAALKREFSDLHGVSLTTLSRRLTAIGYRSHDRRDKGTRRVGVSDEQLARVAAIQRQSMSLRKGVVMPAEDAIEIAEDSGLLPSGVVTPSWFNEWLRTNEASRRQQKRETPHVELKSLGPNHVHQFDFSLAVNWKVFDEKGGQPGVAVPFQYERLVYKNKPPKEGQPRLWRGVVTDHASGAFFVWYSLTHGETVQATLESLYRAWAPKDEETAKRYPFRGVPHLLMVDRGPANRAGLTVRTMERLGVQLNVCEGPRSKGQVERFHGWWEEHFESRMRLEPPASLEQLNRWALDFAVKLCGARSHGRHGQTRSGIWAWHIGRRPETQLRELGCGWEAFKQIAVSEPKRCLVYGNRVIRFQSQRYRAPDVFTPGEQVLAQYSAFEFPKIQVQAQTPGAPVWVCEPVEVDEFGFAAEAAVIGREYKSQRGTETSRSVKRFDEAWEGMQGSESDGRGQPLRVFGHHAEKAAEAQARPVGEEIAVDAPAARTLTRVAARQEVMDRIGRGLTKSEAAHLARVFGEAVEESAIEEAVAAIESGVRAEVVTFGGAE